MTVQVLKEWPPPYRVVRSLDDAAKVARWLSSQKPVLAVDTESAGLHWWRDPMRMVQLSDGRTTWVVPARHAPPVLDKLAVYFKARTQAPRRVAAANVKYDFHVLQDAPLALERTAGPGTATATPHGLTLPWGRLEDIQTYAAALFPGEAKDLKSLGVEHFDPMGAILDKWLTRIFHDNGWSKEASEKKPLGWAMIPDDNEVYMAYAAWDAWAAAQAAVEWKPRLDQDAQRVVDLDHSATYVLSKMERRGVRIDRAYCQEQEARLAEHVAAATQSVEMRYGVKVSSTQDLGAFLEKAGEILPRTDGGAPSVAAEVLETLSHPLAREVVALRQTERFRNYFTSLLANAGDGDIVRPSINPLGARTGRASISDPPLHQMPRRKLVRDAFIPRDGNLLAKSDYDQIEMRLLAHFLSVSEGDDTMLRAIAEGDARAARGESGYDLHSMNARAIYGYDINAQVPKTRRTLAKNGGFAKVYGAGGKKFAETVNKGLPEEDRITEAEGKAFIDLLERTFPGLRPFTRRVENTAQARERKGEEPWIKAPSGRRHVAQPGKCLSHDKGCPMSCSGRGRLYFQLPNYLIQGTAADVNKEGLVRLEKAGLADDLILTVHDEAIADTPAEGAHEYARAMAEALQDLTQFRVRLTADSDVVTRWGEGYE